jgi:hypothetical protein
LVPTDQAIVPLCAERAAAEPRSRGSRPGASEEVDTVKRFVRRPRPGRSASSAASPGALYLLAQWHTGGQIDDEEWRYREHLLHGCDAGQADCKQRSA